MASQQRNQGCLAKEPKKVGATSGSAGILKAEKDLVRYPKAIKNSPTKKYYKNVIPVPPNTSKVDTNHLEPPQLAAENTSGRPYYLDLKNNGDNDKTREADAVGGNHHAALTDFVVAKPDAAVRGKKKKKPCKLDGLVGQQPASAGNGGESVGESASTPSSSPGAFPSTPQNKNELMTGRRGQQKLDELAQKTGRRQQQQQRCDGIINTKGNTRNTSSTNDTAPQFLSCGQPQTSGVAAATARQGFLIFEVENETEAGRGQQKLAKLGEKTGLKRLKTAVPGAHQETSTLATATTQQVFLSFEVDNEKEAGRGQQKLAKLGQKTGLLLKSSGPGAQPITERAMEDGGVLPQLENINNDVQHRTKTIIDRYVTESHNMNNPQQRTILDSLGQHHDPTTSALDMDLLDQYRNDEVANPSFPSTVQASQNNDGLVVANIVEESSKALQLAEDVDLDASKSRREETKKWKYSIVILVVVVCCLVLIVTLSIWFGRGDKDDNNTTDLTLVPTTMYWKKPPLDNLHLLYDVLPEKTKASLSAVSTPQYKAWDWLLGHQNITNLEEWRKQQLFALVTFFYAFEGPLWNEPVRRDWLDDTMHECSWIKRSPARLKRAYEMIAVKNLQTTEYTIDDFLLCNAEGQIQTIALGWNLLGGSNPSIPPEIALLTSLGIISTPFCNLEVPLDDLMPTELAQLPRLKMLNFADNAIHGTIPDHFLQFQALKHLILARNALAGPIPQTVPRASLIELQFLQNNVLSGTLPSEFALMTSMTSLQFWDNLLSGTIPLELWAMTNIKYFNIGQNHITGSLPPELSQMVSLEHFDMMKCRISGSIPSQIGLNTNMKRLWFAGNSLNGYLPSELGLMTNIQLLWLHENDFSGDIPSELWRLSQMRDLDLSSLPLLAGTVPEELCYLKRNSSCVYEDTYMDDFPCRLDFNCTKFLCGCDCLCHHPSK